MKLSIYLMIATILISGCGPIKEPVKPFYEYPTINSQHPEYKTIVAPLSVDEVKSKIVMIAKQEKFKDVIVTGNTILLKGKHREISSGRSANPVLAGLAGGTTGMVLGGPVIGGGLAAVGALAGVLLKDVDNAREGDKAVSANGIAKLTGLGKKTKIQLNFNRGYYQYREKSFSTQFREATSNPFSLSSPSRGGYRLNRVEEINDPDIYRFAFEKLYQNID